MTVDESIQDLTADKPLTTEIEISPVPQTAPYSGMRKKFACAVIVQLGILAAMYAPPAHTLATGENILLAVSPMDPWDMFRGQYMTLNYVASAVAGTGLHTGQTVYVALRKEHPYAIPEKAYSFNPTVDHTKYLVMRGTVQWIGTTCKNVGVKYGIERFYIPETSKQRLQTAEHFCAEVAVDRDGSSVLKRIIPRNKTKSPDGSGSAGLESTEDPDDQQG